MKETFSLKIAGIIIRIDADRPCRRVFDSADDTQRFARRLGHFFYSGKRPPQIRIAVRAVPALPPAGGGRIIFSCYQAPGELNWDLRQAGRRLLFRSVTVERETVAYFGRDCTRAQAYVLLREGGYWSLPGLLYEFLQVLLIGYLAKRGKGVFLHSCGIRDRAGRGWAFAGKSAAGKSTLASLWYGERGWSVLNDDRIIVTREQKGFVMHPGPWHGSFSDYFAYPLREAGMRKLFFIYHAKKNRSRRMDPVQAFKALYPAIFLPLWDGKQMMNIIDFCRFLTERTECYSLGFVKGRSAVRYLKESP